MAVLCESNLKILFESFSKRAVGLSVFVHQNGCSYILATSFIAFFFLGIVDVHEGLMIVLLLLTLRPLWTDQKRRLSL